MTINPDFPPLETDRLRLRPMNGSDLDFVFRHFSDPAVNRYLLDEEPLTTLAQAQEIIDFYVPPAGKAYNRWVIIRRADDRPIGTCGFHQWQRRHQRAEIGYDLEEASWGRGYMTEALRVVLRHGFERLALNRVEALVYPENMASLRLLERLGFQKEGLLRDAFRQGAVAYDHWLLSLLKAEWSLST